MGNFLSSNMARLDVFRFPCTLPVMTRETRGRLGGGGGKPGANASPSSEALDNHLLRVALRIFGRRAKEMRRLFRHGLLRCSKGASVQRLAPFQRSTVKAAGPSVGERETQ